MAASDKVVKSGGTVVATVAARRSVEVDGKRHGPGSKVTLAVEEVDKLVRAGYLVNPKAVIDTSKAVPKVAVTKVAPAPAVDAVDDPEVDAPAEGE